MGRWSPTVLPQEPSPFWDSFNYELSRSLAQSPAEAIAWERNKIAKDRDAENERRWEAERPERLTTKGFRPTTREDYEEVDVGVDSPIGRLAPGMIGSKVPGRLKKPDAPTTMDGKRVWQYAPEKVAREETNVFAETLRGEREARRRAIAEGTPDSPDDYEQVRVDMAPGMPMVPGRPKENFFAAYLTPEQRATYILEGNVPSRGTTRAGGRLGGAPPRIRSQDGTYLERDPETGAWVPARTLEGEEVAGWQGRGPARTEGDRIRAQERDAWMREYNRVKHPTGQFAVPGSEEEAVAAADAAVEAARAFRRKQNILNGLE